MCVVSAITEDWSRRRSSDWSDWSTILPSTPVGVLPEFVPKWKYDELKKEMEALKKLLVAAKLYDESTGQPDCEKEENVKMIKRLAKLVNVDLSEII